MHKFTSGAHLVCVWAELKCCTCRGHFWSWTPVFVPVWAFNSGFVTCFWRWTPELGRRLALNASLRRQFLCKIWTIIYCWKALDVYFSTQLEVHHFEFCSSRKSTLSAGRSESNSISSPFSTSESDFCSSPSISARKYLKSQKNTQTHSKVQKCEFNIKTNENIPKSN